MRPLFSSPSSSPPTQQQQQLAALRSSSSSRRSSSPWTPTGPADLSTFLHLLPEEETSGTILLPSKGFHPEPLDYLIPPQQGQKVSVFIIIFIFFFWGGSLGNENDEIHHPAVLRLQSNSCIYTGVKKNKTLLYIDAQI